jgi:ammonium transporter, Amt family
MFLLYIMLSYETKMLGTFILWFGWYSFNSGSAVLHELNANTASYAALAAANTTLAGGTAGIVALMLNLWLSHRTTGQGYFDIQLAMNGCIAGFVSVTAGCAVIETWASVVVGFFAGCIFIAGGRLIVRFRIDDAVDAVPVHLFSGCWGVVSVGFFASPTRQQAVYGRSYHSGLIYSWKQGNFDATLLGVQCLGLIFICAWVVFTMLPFFLWLDKKGWLRIDPIDEVLGLDARGNIGACDTMSDDDNSTDDMVGFKARRRTRNAELVKKRMEGLGSSSTTLPVE